MDIIACTTAAGNSEIPLHGKQGTESKERTESAEILFFLYTHTQARHGVGEIGLSVAAAGHTIEPTTQQDSSHRMLLEYI